MAIAQGKKQINKSYRQPQIRVERAGKFQFNSFAREFLDLKLGMKLNIYMQAAGLFMRLDADKDGFCLQQNATGTFYFNSQALRKALVLHFGKNMDIDVDTAVFRLQVIAQQTKDTAAPSTFELKLINAHTHLQSSPPHP